MHNKGADEICCEETKVLVEYLRKSKLYNNLTRHEGKKTRHKGKDIRKVI